MNKMNVMRRNLDTKNISIRESGLIPGMFYGPDIQNMPIKIKKYDLLRSIKREGEVYIVQTNNKKYFARVDEIQQDPVTRDILHISLVQLPKGEKNEVAVPVNLKGQPIGVEKGGVLVVNKTRLSVEATPKDMPDEIITNIRNLDIGDSIQVKDINWDGNGIINEDLDEVVAFCRPPVKSNETEREETKENINNAS